MLQAIFTNGVDEITVRGLTQWDKGQAIEINLSSLPATFQVHFSWKSYHEAYVVEATSDGWSAIVPIPNIILQKCRTAVAWVYLVEDEAGETVKTIYLPIVERAKPSDYVYTEIEIQSIANVVNKAQGFADNAAKSALEAQEAQAKAEEHAADAKASADDASDIVASLGTVILNKDGLPDGTDFDTIKDNGMYYAYSSRTYPNSPGKYMGVLTVFRRSDGAVVQDFVNASSGNRYARYNVDGWTAWQQGTAMHNRKALAKDADFNTIVEDGIYYAQTPHEQTNRPESGAGLLTVTTQNSVVTQDWVNIQTGARWVRWGMNGTWRDWMSCIPDTVMRNMGEIANGTDFDTIKANGLYYAYASYTYGNSPDDSTGLMHVFLRSDGFVVQDYTNPDNGKRYARYCYRDGTWTAWKQSNAAKDRNAVYYAFGDSTTYGQIATTGGQSPYNYPACVGRLLDMKVKNKAVGGQGLLKDWDTIHTDYIDGLDMSDAKLVTVGWAYNDGQSRYETIEIGTAKDTTPDTYTGKYYTIMKEFQEKCPQAQIVLITGYGMTGTTYSQFKSGYNFADGKFYSMKQMYDLLEEMCNINGWCCINQARGTWITKHNWTTYIGDGVHPTADGYIRYGNFMAAKIAGIYANLAAW